MEEAIQYTEERLQQALASGDLYAQKELRVKLGQLQFDAYQYHRCLNTLDKAMILVRQFRDDQTEAVIHKTQAAAYHALGRHSDALAEHRALLGIARSGSSIRHVRMQIAVYIDMATAYRDRAEHRRRRAVSGERDVRRGLRCVQHARNIMMSQETNSSSSSYTTTSNNTNINTNTISGESRNRSVRGPKGRMIQYQHQHQHQLQRTYTSDNDDMMEWTQDMEASADYTEAALYLVLHVAGRRHQCPSHVLHSQQFDANTTSQQQQQQSKNQQPVDPKREDDMNHAERLLLRAIVRHRRNGNETALSKDYRALADVAMGRGKDKTAMGCLRSALEQAVNAGDVFEGAAADEAMAHLYFHRHRFDRAYTHFMRALRRIPASCTRVRQRLTTNAASAQHATDCLRRARQGAPRLRRIMQGQGGWDAVKEARRMVTDGMHMGHAGYLEDAARALIGWGQRRGERMVEGEGQHHLADALEMKGQLTAAETARRRAVELARQQQQYREHGRHRQQVNKQSTKDEEQEKENNRLLCSALVGLSNVLVEQYEKENSQNNNNNNSLNEEGVNKAEEAERLLREAEQIALDLGEVEDELTVLKSLSYVYAAWGRTEAARETERRIGEVYDEIKGGPTFESVDEGGATDDYGDDDYEYEYEYGDGDGHDDQDDRISQITNSNKDGRHDYGNDGALPDVMVVGSKRVRPSSASASSGIHSPKRRRVL